MVLAGVGGLASLAVGWCEYARAPWMHTKLLSVFIGSGRTGALAGRLRRMSEGEAAKVKPFAIALVVVLALVLFMVLLGPHLMPARA